MASKVTPIKDQVLVKQDPAKELVGREGLIFAPQGSETWPVTATVIAVGPGRITEGGARVALDPGLVPGARVIFKRKPSSALVPDLREGDPNEWRDLIMLREEDILGIIEEE